MGYRNDDRILTLQSGPVGLSEYGVREGLPVLALHGTPASRLMFAIADGPARRAGLKLIAPDRPGYGLSAPVNSPTLAARAEWLERLADALGLDRFAILGISGGGPYATALAARLGTRITALALATPMGPIADLIAGDPQAKSKVHVLHRRFFLHLPRRFFFAPLAGLVAQAFMVSPRGFGGLAPWLARDPDAHILRKPHVREAMLAMTREAFRQGAAGAVGDMQIFSAPWPVDFGAIRAPAMLWQGTADRVVPVAAALHLARSIPECRLITLEGAGHFWVFDEMDSVCQALRDLTAVQSSIDRSTGPL